MVEEDLAGCGGSLGGFMDVGPIVEEPTPTLTPFSKLPT
jgi:hypothetical protein